MITVLSILIIISFCPELKAAITIETWPITNGVEMSLKEWYGESPYSITAQQEINVEQSDSKCDFVTSGVVAALARKRNFGLLSEEQEARALDRFQACLGKLCNNSAMLDAFMRPATFREQIDLLVAVAKLSDILRGRESGDILLNLLVDGELKEILSEVPYPPKFTSDASFDLTPYINVAIKVLQTACASGTLTVTAIDMASITEVFISSLNDRYTSNAISAEEVARVWNMTTLEEYNALWNGIADKVANPTSALAGTCLDPAVAYFNYEKISMARIRQLSMAKGFCVQAAVGESASASGDGEISYSEMAEAPTFEFEYAYLEAAPAPMNPNYDGPPSDPGSSPVSAPGSSGPSADGPPI